MTTPGGQLTPGDENTPPVFGVPEGAYVGDAGAPNAIHDLNTLNESTAKNRMRSPVSVAFNAQRDGLWGLMYGFAEAITGAPPLGHPVDHVEHWMASDRENTGAVLADYGSRLEQKVEPWAVPTVSGLYQTLNRQGDPSWPLSSLLNANFSGETGRAYIYSDSAYHSHSYGDEVARSMAQGGSTKGRHYFAFITPAINRAYSRLNFMVGSVSNPCPMDIAIYVINPDRTMTRQVFVENAGGIPLSEGVATIEFPTWVATQGSYLAVAWLQRGSGNTRPLLGLNDTPRPLPGTVFPRRLAAQSDSTGNSTLPATIDGTNGALVNFTGNWFAPYAELSEDIGFQAAQYVDNFNKGGFLGRPWVSLTGQAPHSAGGAVGIDEGLGGFLAGPRIAIYSSPLTTDQYRVEVQLGPTNHADTRYSWFAVRANNNLRNGAAVVVHNNSISLRAWTVTDVHNIRSGWSTVATTAYSFKQNDIVTADVTGGQIIVSINGTESFRWTMVGLPSGAAGRFLGIGFEKTAAGGSSSTRFNQWRAFDVESVEEVEP